MSKPRLTNADYCRAADTLGCEVAAIKAVAEQESLGAGFDNSDRPKILFERHLFHRLTRGKYDSSHPNISNASAGGYGSSASQYGRFAEAFALDQNAAMMSASWGKFQILGSNHGICGYPTVGDFVDAMKESESNQLDAFCEFVLHNGLDDELTRHDWAGFARGYNGPSFRKNKYDTKIAAGYRKFAREKIDCSVKEAASITMPDPSTSSASPEADGSSELTPTDSQVDQPVPPPIENAPDGKVVIEKETQVGFIAKIKLKLGAWLTTLGGLTGINQYKEQIDGLGLPGWIMIYVLIGAIILFFGWLIYEAIDHFIDIWRKRSLTNALVAANSTPGPQITAAPSGDLDALEKLGYIVVRRK